MTSRMAGPILVTALLLAPLATRAESDDGFQFLEATVAQLQSEMAKGRLTSVELTRAYLERIHKLDQPSSEGDSSFLGVNAIIELNPDALGMARHADQLREAGTVLGPLHGIPVLLKDNIDTHDRMQTGAGSFALVGTPALRDSTVAAKLRAGGAVILGKTTLSEWANFRSFESISGWSGRGGQAHNPYGLDRNPCGSSSGSGAAASANFATVSFGSETDGSIVCPGNANGVVGIKPTVGLTSRAGVVPISHTQDTIGPHARTVADAAAALSVIQSPSYDGRDPATGGVPLGWRGRFPRPTTTNIPTDYTKFLDPHGLKGARIGITRVGLAGFGPPGFPTFVATPQPVLNAIEAAFKVLSDAGAIVVDLDKAGFVLTPATGETGVLLYDFKNDVAAYFATRVGVPVAGGTLQTAIEFNNAHADVEMPFFTQDIFDLSNSLNTTDPNAPQDPSVFGANKAGQASYNISLDLDQAAGVSMDLALSTFKLDAIVSATDNPAWATDLVYGDHFVFGTSGLSGGPGYPIVQVPAGEVFGVPFGISFFGTAFSEPTLIKLASGYEAVTQARAHNLPKITPTVPFDHIQGRVGQDTADGNTMRSAAVSSSAVQAAAVASSAAPTAAAAQNPAASAKKVKKPHYL